MLLEAYTQLTRLASSMDVNDFNHVKCIYCPHPFGSGSEYEIVPVDVPLLPTATPARRPCPAALMPPPTAALVKVTSQAPSSLLPSTRVDFNVFHYLNERSPIIGSGLEEPFDQYGSQFGQEGNGSPVSEEHLLSPNRQHSSPHQSSLQVSPLHLSSTRGGNPVHSKDVDLFSQPKVASLMAQLMDIEPQDSPTHSAFDVAEQLQAFATMEEISVVAPFAEEVQVINCSHIKSCDSKRRLLGTLPMRITMTMMTV